MDQLIGGGAREIIATGCCGSLIDDAEGDFFIPTSALRQEGASLAACAKMRGVIFGQLLFTADSLANVEAHDTRNWGDETFAVEMKLTFDAIVEV